MGPLYYIPGVERSIKLPGLIKFGLGYAFEQRSTAVAVQTGPGGMPGIVVADPTRVEDHKIGYYPQAQTWRKIPGVKTESGSCWVGIYRDAPPKPQDLARLEMLDGHQVILADGQSYVVPIARGAADGDTLGYQCRLPHAVTVDDDGEWVSDGILPRYAPLWQIAEAWWDCKFDGKEHEDGSISFAFAGANDAALRILAANYRLGKAEVALLGLFTQPILRSILDALVDWPVVEEWIKKKLLPLGDGSRTSAGSADELPATDRPAPISGPAVESLASDPP